MIDDILAVEKCGIDSVAANSFINNKMEMKKLIFSENKCKHLHAGKENPFCPDLEVHGKPMKKSLQEKYLGDMIADTILACNAQNVKSRKSKGMGIVSQIMVILETVSLGYFYFEIAILLRESLLINGILFNSEVWCGVTKAQVSDLESVDKLLLRQILGAPISTPVEALYLELGVLPISYILKGRRVMFLHYLLNLEESEMLHMFFKAQLKKPGRNDWTETVKQDLVDLNISLSFDEIETYSHEQFKQIVKKKCRSTAFAELMKAKSNHSKMSPLPYDELKVQSYLIDGNFHSGDARLLFSFRTRMVKVRNNYKWGSNDLYCPLCDLDMDTQEHLLICPKLNQSPLDISYNSIFGNDGSNMKKTFEALKKSLHLREEMMDDIGRLGRDLSVN